MPELKTAPLSAGEKAWCKKLERLLLAAPTRFGLYTIGDCDLTVFDALEAKRIGLPIEDGLPGHAGLEFTKIKSRVNIHGLCG
jgi:hypothetical protein